MFCEFIKIFIEFLRNKTKQEIKIAVIGMVKWKCATLQEGKTSNFLLQTSLKCRKTTSGLRRCMVFFAEWGLFQNDVCTSHNTQKNNFFIVSRCNIENDMDVPPSQDYRVCNFHFRTKFISTLHDRYQNEIIIIQNKNFNWLQIWNELISEWLVKKWNLTLYHVNRDRETCGDGMKIILKMKIIKFIVWPEEKYH